MPSETELPRRLQLLLNEACRDAAGRERARQAAEDLGFTLSGEGTASFSARLSKTQFTKLFGTTPSSSGALAVPAALSPFVASISEAPQHLSFKPKKGADDESL